MVNNANKQEILANGEVSLQEVGEVRAGSRSLKLCELGETAIIFATCTLCNTSIENGTYKQWTVQTPYFSQSLHHSSLLILNVLVSHFSTTLRPQVV